MIVTILRYNTGSMLQNNDFVKGDVCYAVDTQRCYVWSGNAWVAFPNAVERDNTSSHPTNCVNCGAVLHSCCCEYCGTEYFD